MIRLKKIKFKKANFNKFNFFHILKKGIYFFFKSCKKKINNIKNFKIFIENEFDNKKYKEKYLFFFNLIQLGKIKKKKLTLMKERKIKFNKKFFKLKILKLQSRMFEFDLRYKYYLQK
jgi:hypothetical protein